MRRRAAASAVRMVRVVLKSLSLSLSLQTYSLWYSCSCAHRLTKKYQTNCSLGSSLRLGCCSPHEKSAVAQRANQCPGHRSLVVHRFRPGEGHHRSHCRLRTRPHRSLAYCHAARSSVPRVPMLIREASCLFATCICKESVLTRHGGMGTLMPSRSSIAR